MGLSCYCDDEYDWYYEISEYVYSASSWGICYGCHDKIFVGDDIYLIFSYQLNEDGEECNYEHLGRICEKCWGHLESLKALGYCVSADLGFIEEAMDEYRSMVPRNEIITKRWTRGGSNENES